MQGHNLNDMIEDTWDFSPEHFEGLDNTNTDEGPIDITSLKSELEELQTQLSIDEMTNKFSSMTPEMADFFGSEENIFAPGRFETFLTTLKQIRNKIKVMSEDLRKDVRKKQIPNHERIKLLVGINKEFKQEVGKVEALIESAERMKGLRDKLLERGIDVSQFQATPK